MPLFHHHQLDWKVFPLLLAGNEVSCNYIFFNAPGACLDSYDKIVSFFPSFNLVASMWAVDFYASQFLLSLKVQLSSKDFELLLFKYLEILDSFGDSFSSWRPSPSYHTWLYFKINVCRKPCSIILVLFQLKVIVPNEKINEFCSPQARMNIRRILVWVSLPWNRTLIFFFLLRKPNSYLQEEDLHYKYYNLQDNKTRFLKDCRNFF